MKCEIIAVGTELLLGQIVDTNSSWMGEQLALAGIDSHYQTKVGDNWDRIEDAVRLGLERSDAVIMCGGLGPTQDDITRDVIARVMGVDLERDASIEQRIRDMFSSRGREMPENNLRQAMVPVGASTIPQQPGTAPGLLCPIGDKVIYAVPGVPYEMKEMFSGTIIGDLQERAGVQAVIASRVLRTWGQSESGLAEMLAGRIDELDAAGNPTLAFLASGIEGIKVRVTAKASTDVEVASILDAEERVLREMLGDLVFALDDDNMEAAVTQLLAARGLRIGVAETMTGGFLSGRLTAAPGSHAVFAGAVVHGPTVDEDPVTLAAAARDQLGADVAIATVSEFEADRPTGTTHLAVVGADLDSTETVRLPGDRDRIRQFSCISVLNLLRLRLEGHR